jgi:hypothetical protein
MPINDDGVVEYVEINGEKVPKIVVPAADTKAEHIRQDVVISAAIHKILEGKAGDV